MLNVKHIIKYKLILKGKAKLKTTPTKFGSDRAVESSLRVTIQKAIAGT